VTVETAVLSDVTVVVVGEVVVAVTVVDDVVVSITW
jgi:hypothetical protein